MVNGIGIASTRPQNNFREIVRSTWRDSVYNRPITRENSVFENVVNGLHNAVTLRPEEGLTGFEKLAAILHNLWVSMYVNPFAGAEYMSKGMSTLPKAPKGYKVRQLSDGRLSVTLTNGNYGARVYTPQEYQAWVNKLNK